MPSATAGGANLSAYFKLDGSRTITGPSLLALAAGSFASDAFTIRGAAGQTGKLLVLENSALADVFTFDNAGNLVITTDLPPVLATQTYGDRRTLTLTNNPASIVPTDFGNSNGISLTITQPSDSTVRTVYGINQTILMAGRFRQAYGNEIYVENSSAIAANGIAASQISTYHIGAGLLGLVNGQETYTFVTGPVTTHNGAYFYADNRGASGTFRGMFVSANHSTGTLTGTLTGAYIEAVLASGTAASIIGLDVSVSGAGSSATYALRTTGGDILAAGRTLTGSAATSLLSLAQTWNTSGTPAAILLNITNTASNAASKLLDLQVSGVSRFNVLATGFVGIGTATPATALDIVGTAGAQFRLRSVVTNAAVKAGNIQIGHYTNAEEDFGVFSATSTSVNNFVDIGGGYSAHNAATIVRVFTAANNTTLEGTERVRIDSSGNIGIGTSSIAARLDILGGTAAQFRLSSTISDVTIKNAYIQGRHYTNAEEDAAILFMASGSTTNALSIGGGSGSLNTATSVAIYTAANNTTVTGTLRLTIDSTGMFTIWDGGNFALGTTTGTKIGTATTQKLGFFNATPIVRPVLATGAGATPDNIITVLQNLGLVGQT